VLHPLPEDTGQSCAHAIRRHARPQPADRAKPGGEGIAQQRGLTVEERLLLQRNPEIGRVAAQRFAEESRRHDSHDRERMPLDEKRGAHDRRIATVGAVPRVVAHDDSGCGGWRIVGGAEHTASERVDAESREVIASDVHGAQRRRRRVDVRSPHADARAAGLKGGHLFEFRRLGLQPLEQGQREHPPAILRAALHAAGVAVADAIEPRWIADRQRLQHHGVHEREDGCRAADAQSERQNRGRGEHARDPELAQCVAQFSDEITHCKA
jgi:hypothetical protein